MEATSGGELIGRERERARLTGLVEKLPAAGGSLALHGDPGVGKSALLSWLSGTAETHGVHVLTVTAAEGDAGSPYAGLRLLFPGMAWSPATAAPPPARMVVPTLDLVAELAGRSPLVLVVDDAQWLDSPSWTVLTFVARRLAHHPAAIVFALREGATATARLSGSGLPGMTVDPLDPAGARLLLDRHAPGIRPDLRDTVLSLAGGNPLGLVELAASARRPPPPGADLPLTRRLEQAFVPPAGSLPATARTLLQVAAVDDGSSADTVVDAARRLDPEIRAEDLTAAEEARIICVDETFELRFRHPLRRSAIRQAMGEARRRHAHRALADVLDAHPGRRIWHLACAAAGPDERLAAQLAGAADEARRRSAMTSAARMYERAAQLSADPRTRTDRLLWAAASAYDAGDPATATRLVGALPRRLSASGQARRVHLRESLRDDGRSGGEGLRGHLDTAGPAMHGLGLRTLGFFLAGPDRSGRDAVVSAARGLSRGITEAQTLCLLSLADPAGRCAEVLPRIRRHARDLTGSPEEMDLVALAGLGVGAMPETIRLSATAAGRLRGQGADGLLARCLAVQATAAAQVGNVLLAEKCAAEASRLSAETSQPFWRFIADLAWARAAALRGDAATALSRTGNAPWPALVRLVRGSVAAAGGRPENACDELAPLFDPTAPSFHPQVRFWALSTFAEAAVICGQKRRLHELLDGLGPSRSVGSPVLTVALAYTTAALASSEEAYTAALAHPDLPAWPFELARLQLAYGGWLRRRRRGADARRQLRSATHTFTTFGAHPWATRADAELRAAGERISPGPNLHRLLTPQEHQIAELAADGLSNREIAARLLLSPRSVDSHLSRAYRKAGVSSRAELTRLILTTG